TELAHRADESGGVVSLGRFTAKTDVIHLLTPDVGVLSVLAVVSLSVWIARSSSCHLLIGARQVGGSQRMLPTTVVHAVERAQPPATSRKRIATRWQRRPGPVPSAQTSSAA